MKSAVGLQRAAKFKVAQIIDIVLLALNVFLMLEAVLTFSELQRIDYANGEELNPNKNFIPKSKFDFLQSNLIILLYSTDHDDLTDEQKEITILQVFYFWSYLEIILFYSYIYSVILYLACTAISPFTVY